jgi:ribosomal protein S18 acetylase RimI-like enzyme
LFAQRPAAYCHIALCDKQIGGLALYLNFSTWTGVHGIYLEDLYVRAELRGLGLGEALLRTLAELCLERGYARLEWSVLDWNEPALGFYRALGAQAMQEWTVHRVTGDALRAVALGSE